ncbi:MAG: S-layer homology domain-containing protein, partial [Acidimicrobiia bacterium]|nr:S-layer homology domain-containing protein [Acidimicrobiia bacterium]
KLMFASISRFRRQVAVLTALALMASMLAAAPAVADEHPEADFTATYTACVDIPPSGFEDVPENHANAGDIDCIAYYGITKGTSATTYSPLMSVTREHMALFLIRLANRVGIEVTSTPDDPGFTDTGDLSEGSQTAIAQLADLDITKGTSATTYSPGDSVTRGQMALFIHRLMGKMTAGAGGSSTDDVADSEMEVKSPFTDLGSATKTAYDAITALWELGVVSGISDTAYAPSALITRAAMAEFMVGVMNHSNLRPAGLSIQANPTSGFGPLSPEVVVSYRNDSFAPVEGVAVQIFSLDQNQEFDEDGGCPNGVDCAWSENSEPTDTDGNILPAVAAIADGESATYYAWMGDADADDNEFDSDTANAVSVTIASSTDADLIAVSSDANKQAAGALTADAAADGLLINSDDDSSVTITAQLQSDEDDPVNLDNDNQSDVAKSGVEITVGVTRSGPGGTIFANASYAKVTTDDSGSITFTVEGPGGDDENDNDTRDDLITFTIDDGDDTTTDIFRTARIRWQDDERVPNNATVDSGPAYQVIDDGAVGFRVTVRLYDQYGDPIGTDETADITVAGGTPVERPISSRGVATYSANMTTTAGTNVTVAVEITGVATTIDNDDVMAVSHAVDDGPAVPDGDISAVYAEDNRFRIEGTLYTYDSDDTFLIGNKVVDMAAFEKELSDDDTVDILVYDDDGSSVFALTSGG